VCVVQIQQKGLEHVALQSTKFLNYFNNPALNFEGQSRVTMTCGYDLDLDIRFEHWH